MLQLLLPECHLARLELGRGRELRVRVQVAVMSTNVALDSTQLYFFGLQLVKSKR